MLKAIRQKLGKKPGDKIQVQIELDTQPRVLSLPPDLKKALALSPGLAKAFEKLSYTARKEHCLAIASAKRPQTRQQRLQKIILSLKPKAA